MSLNSSAQSAAPQTRLLPFSPTHYSVFTDLWNQAYPDLERTELEMRLADLSPASELASNRWMAEHNGITVAVGGYEHSEGELFHPRKFQLHLIVDPNHRNQGIGAALYQRVVDELRLKNAILVRVWVRGDRSESLRFLAVRGFIEEMRTFHSSLDVTAFDLSHLAKYSERLKKNGYQFMTFDDLVKDPERNRKAYELYREVMLDIPSAEPPSLPSFGEFEQRITATPERFRAHFVATHHDEYVGVCILLPKGRGRRELYADTLGIKRAYRGRGIAQALSWCAIEYAKRRGYSLLSADNFMENRGIIPLLDKLGFSNKSVWILFSKSLASQ